MKMLSKKLSKSLLVSVLAVVLVGSAAAAFTWISNTRTTVVTVREMPITLSGDFVDSPLTSEEYLQAFNYTVNDVSNALGYVFIQFRVPLGEILNPGDIQMRLTVENAQVTYIGYLAVGYPTNTPTDQLTFVFGDFYHDPFDFGFLAPNGTINVYTTYNVAYGIEATIRLTSTSS